MTSRLTLTLPDEQIARLRADAERERRSLSNWTMLVLEAGYKALEPEEAPPKKKQA